MSRLIDGTGVCVPVDDPRIPSNDNDNDGDNDGDDNDGDNDGNTPNDGDPCEVDGKQGTYQDSVCVISTNTVNPGVIDLTGDSTWGDGGNGGGNGGGRTGGRAG